MATIYKPTDSLTISFSEKYNNFKCALDWKDITTGAPPECFAALGDSFVSFLGGKLWHHNINQTRGSFYGHVYKMVVSIVSAMNPLIEKVYNVITVNSNNKFYAPNYDDIQVVSGNQNTAKSKLFKEDFVKKEGVLYAPFNRNACHFSSSPDINGLKNGAHLRGQSMEVSLTNEDETETILHSVIVKCTSSKMSG